MRKIEIGLICSIVLAIVGKLLKFPFANVVFILSVLILSSLYLYVGFALFNGIAFRKIFKKESYKEISTPRIIGSIGVGILLSITLLGILFRVMMWPGSTAMLLLGIIGLVSPLIVAIIKFIQKRSDFYPKIFLRIILYTVIGVSLYFSKYLILELKYADYPVYIEVVKELDKDPNNLELQKQEAELHRQIYYNRTGRRN